MLITGSNFILVSPYLVNELVIALSSEVRPDIMLDSIVLDADLKLVVIAIDL